MSRCNNIRMVPISRVESGGGSLIGHEPTNPLVTVGGKPKKVGLAGAAKLAIPGILLTVVCLLPYLNKAYTIDDPLFLLSARQILKNPLQPMSYPICWMGNDTCVKSAANLGPLGSQPLMGYLLVPVVLEGSAEWMAHTLQIPLGCIAVLAMVRLALRFGCNRLQAAMAGLMLVAIPPFLSMASTAMPDILALALGLTGFERLLAWKDEGRWRNAIIAGLGLGLAPCARPHLILFLAVSALWLLNELQLRSAMQQLRREAYLWTPILIAAGILIVFEQVTRDRSPASQAHEALLSWRQIPQNLYAYFLYLSFPLPFMAVWLATHWRKAPVLFVLPSILVLAYHFALHPSNGVMQEWPKTAMLFGLTAFAHMIYQSVRTWNRTSILLGLWMLIPLPITIYIHLPIKYLLIVLPAIILIVIRELSTLAKPRELSVYGTIVCVYAAFSSVLLRADADFAESSRRASAELIAPHVAAGEKVWFSGQWGLYWYAQKAGAKPYNPGESGPKQGELFAIGLAEGDWSALKHFPHRELVDARSYPSPHGRTVGSGGGLYTNYLGYSLWVWKPDVTDKYELWRIQ